jgi:cyclomaltodextrinase / maltogenic alpha-amylase / neopullulanase
MPSPLSSRSRPTRCRSLAVLLAGLLGAVLLPGLAGAADLRFVTLRPAGAAGEWSALIEAKTRKPLAFWGDGQPLTAETADAGGGLQRVRLTGVPAGVSRIEAGHQEKDRRVPLAAVEVARRGAAWDDWVVYHVMLGMFANGNPGNDGEITGWKHPNYAGGDLQGVLARASHLQELGVSAVWLSPLFASRSSHGYDTSNYFRIGDQFAVPGRPEESLALFRALRDDLHGRGIKVILDLALNHATANYQRPEGDPKGLRPRATAARQEAEKVWEGWGSGYRYWDFGHEPTRRFLRDVALHWLKDEGVDGLRLDYVRGVPHDFWAELRREVEAAKPGAYLVGEAWIDAGNAEANARDIATYYQPVDGAPQFESLLDFPMQITFTEVFARGGAATQLEATLQEEAALYGPGARPTYFLDNHDTARFLAWADRPERLTAALGYLASLSGPIVLFYGTETGLAHGGPKAGFTDVGRIPMPWDRLDRNLVGKVAAMLKTRREHPALSHGGRLPLIADKETLVTAKVSPEETVLVGVNLGAAPRTVELDLAGLAPAGTAFQLLLGGAAPAAGEGGKVTWTLPPLSTTWAAAARPRA